MLQEVCQKNMYKMPIYNTINVGYIKESNIILWKTLLKVFDKLYETPDNFKNKKDAENHIAYIAYVDYVNQSIQQVNQPIQQVSQPIQQVSQPIQQVSQPIQQNKTPFNTPDITPLFNYTDLLMQINDISKEMTVNKETKETKESVYIVLIDLENIQPQVKHIKSNIEYHCFYSSYTTVDTSKYTKNCIMHEIEHPTSEAADHLITYTAAKLANKNNTFIILSNDKSMSVLQKLLIDDGIKTIHINKNSKFNEYLEKV